LLDKNKEEKTMKTLILKSEGITVTIRVKKISIEELRLVIKKLESLYELLEVSIG
jgi:hypothetical protein